MIFEVDLGWVCGVWVWVGDFIVGTIVFAIVLTMEKISVSGLAAVWFRLKNLTAIAHPIAPIVPKLIGNPATKAKNQLPVGRATT